MRNLASMTSKIFFTKISEPERESIATEKKDKEEFKKERKKLIYDLNAKLTKLDKPTSEDIKDYHDFVLNEFEKLSKESQSIPKALENKKQKQKQKQNNEKTIAFVKNLENEDNFKTFLDSLETKEKQVEIALSEIISQGEKNRYATVVEQLEERKLDERNLGKKGRKLQNELYNIDQEQYPTKKIIGSTARSSRKTPIIDDKPSKIQTGYQLIKHKALEKLYEGQNSEFTKTLVETLKFDESDINNFLNLEENASFSDDDIEQKKMKKSLILAKLKINLDCHPKQEQESKRSFSCFRGKKEDSLQSNLSSLIEENLEKETRDSSSEFSDIFTRQYLDFIEKKSNEIFNKQDSEKILMLMKAQENFKEKFGILKTHNNGSRIIKSKALAVILGEITGIKENFKEILKKNISFDAKDIEDFLKNETDSRDIKSKALEIIFDETTTNLDFKKTLKKNISFDAKDIEDFLSKAGDSRDIKSKALAIIFDETSTSPEFKEILKENIKFDRINIVDFLAKQKKPQLIKSKALEIIFDETTTNLDFKKTLKNIEFEPKDIKDFLSKAEDSQAIKSKALAIIFDETSTSIEFKEILKKNIRFDAKDIEDFLKNETDSRDIKSKALEIIFDETSTSLEFKETLKKNIKFDAKDIEDFLSKAGDSQAINSKALAIIFDKTTNPEFKKILENYKKFEYDDIIDFLNNKPNPPKTIDDKIKAIKQLESKVDNKSELYTLLASEDIRNKIHTPSSIQISKSRILSEANFEFNNLSASNIALSAEIKLPTKPQFENISQAQQELDIRESHEILVASRPLTTVSTYQRPYPVEPTNNIRTPPIKQLSEDTPSEPARGA